MTDVELVVDAGARLGEGPVWDHRAGVLRWVDILGREVHTFDPATGTDTSTALPWYVGVVALRAAGGLLAAVQGGFVALDPGTGERSWVARLDDARGTVRMNDGEVDPHGRFWAGTMHVDSEPGRGDLHVLHPDGRVTTAVRGVTVSNGLAWLDDAGSEALYVDTPTGRVDRLVVDPRTAEVVERRRFASVAGDAAPDGLTVDADGGVWVALWGGWRVQRFGPDGVADGAIRVPAAQVTSVAFGGPDLQDLYVTTATDGLGAADLADQPAAGGVFRCRPGVAGRPARLAGA